MRIGRNFVSKVVAGLAVLVATVVFTSSSASALTFNSNRIIDDAIFNNSSSMSASAIDGFLNQFPNSCISTNSGFGAVQPTGYSPSGGYQYGSTVSAGNVIASAAQAYGINPQVLLSTLQKEQSIVTGSAGCSTNRIAKAVGYGCPDSGGSYSYSGLNLYTRNGTTFTTVDGICVNSAAKAGFSQQVIRAAWLFRFAEQRSEGNIGWAVINGNWDNSDDPQSCYSGPMTQGTYQRCPSGATTYYDGYTTIDGTPTHMDTGATAALYWYTPHFSGNQNFFNIFTGWFGTTTTSGFNWDPVSQGAYTDSSKTTPIDTSNLLPGMRAWLVVTVRNSGTQTWYRGKVNLATSQPNDRDSLFFDSSWPGRNRVAMFNEASVAPGQTATYEFKITATREGTYKEYLNLVAEGVTWMNDLGMYFYLKVNHPIYQWSPYDQKIYTDSTEATSENLESSIPGSRHWMVFKVRNTGNTTWYHGVVNLAATWPMDRTSAIRDGSWLSGNRPTTLQEPSVAPGQIGTFKFWANTPVDAGTYKEYFNLVVEGVTWMNDLGMYYYVGANPPYTWQPYQQTMYSDEARTVVQDPANISRNGRYYITLKVKNIGRYTWNRGQVNLATTQPRDRDSLFFDSSWPGRNRAATLQEPSVAPGQIGTFNIKVTAPNRTGVYKEYFNLVAENQAWMNDIGLYFYFNITN